jgi:hypothetical protein
VVLPDKRPHPHRLESFVEVGAGRERITGGPMTIAKLIVEIKKIKARQIVSVIQTLV